MNEKKKKKSVFLSHVPLREEGNQCPWFIPGSVL